MRTFGLIGYPLSQSFSQKYFTEKFDQENINARYLNFPIASIDELPGLIQHHPYIAGLNVTIPYKEQVFKYLTEIDAIAKDIAAVNVIKFTWNKSHAILKGYNTDTIGFTNSLTPLLKTNHTKALILGTGGAAKSVAYSLKKLGILYRYVSRNPQGSSQVSYNSLTREIIESFPLIINSSPLGMYPNIETYPDIPYMYITNNHLLYDLVYNPEITEFLRRGKEHGAQIKNGLEMLHIQAQEAWKIWNE
ncbi:MAG: shikimate dehydrogenase [Marinilabiliaceae bacterium]|nr:shikimate dehydrogenase [Marinilabiliaceae bacterium]